MTILLIIELIISIALISAILVQSGTGGLGPTFGGTSSYHTKRGVEKGLFYVTIALAFLFTVVSLAIVVY